MQCTSVFLALSLAALPAFTRAAEPLDAFNVIWDTPSADHHGSMPLGNGEIALNAWMTRDGDLHFYIARTDAWDDNSRLVKVGKIRVHFEPNPIVAGSAFYQELKLKQGRIEFLTGGGGDTRIALWVDANQPVIHVTADSTTPLAATASVELWRTQQQELADLQGSDVILRLRGPDQPPDPLVIEPDTILTQQQGRIGWLHHNLKSVGPPQLAQQQGLTGFPQPDPLLHRTFGAVVTAEGGERLDDLRLRSPSSTSHRINVFVLTRHPSTPEAWLTAMDETMRHVEAQDFAVRLAAHEAWWSEFWDRSWIRASTVGNCGPDVNGKLTASQAGDTVRDEACYVSQTNHAHYVQRFTFSHEDKSAYTGNQGIIGPEALVPAVPARPIRRRTMSDVTDDRVPPRAQRLPTKAFR